MSFTTLDLLNTVDASTHEVVDLLQVSDFAALGSVLASCRTATLRSFRVEVVLVSGSGTVELALLPAGAVASTDIMRRSRDYCAMSFGPSRPAVQSFGFTFGKNPEVHPRIKGLCDWGATPAFSWRVSKGMQVFARLHCSAAGDFVGENDSENYGVVNAAIQESTAPTGLE
jgi:hypothetical protein